MAAARYCVECQAGPLPYSGTGRPTITCSPACYQTHERRRERNAYLARTGREPAQRPRSA